MICPHCGGPLWLIALVKREETIQALLSALHLPRAFHSPGPPKVVNPLPLNTAEEEFGFSGEGEGTDWPEYPD